MGKTISELLVTLFPCRQGLPRVGAAPRGGAALCHAGQAAAEQWVSFALICSNNSPLALTNLSRRETGQMQAEDPSTWQDGGTGVMRRQAFAFYTTEK